MAPLLARATQRGEAYVELFVVILQNVNKEETVQYVLALLDDLLVGARAIYACMFARAFRAPSAARRSVWVA